MIALHSDDIEHFKQEYLICQVKCSGATGMPSTPLAKLRQVPPFINRFECKIAIFMVKVTHQL